MIMGLTSIFVMCVGTMFTDIISSIMVAASGNGIAVPVIIFAVIGTSLWIYMTYVLKNKVVYDRDTVYIVGAYIACAVQVGMITFLMPEQFTLFVLGIIGLIMMGSIISTCCMQDKEDVYEDETFTS